MIWVMDVPQRKNNEQQHSFESFRPLSPEASKGVFTFTIPVPRIFARKKNDKNKKSPGIDKLQKQETRVTYQAPYKSASPKLKYTQAQPLSKTSSWASPDSRLLRTKSSPLLSKEAGNGPKYHAGYGNQSSASPFSDSNASGNRNLNAVLRRLSIIAGGQEYKEEEFKQYWMPDENCKECYECGDKFNTFRRKHHCRLCGQIFCYRCCYLEIPGHLMGYSGGLRVCNYCHKVVNSYNQDDDMSGSLEQIKADLHAVSMDSGVTSVAANPNLGAKSSGFPFKFDDEENFLSAHARTQSTASIQSICYERVEKEMSTPMRAIRSPFDAFGVCAAEADQLKQDSMRDLWHSIMSPRSGLELQSHRFRLKTYNNCLLGSELVDWLLTYEKASNRSQAVAISQALLDWGWLEAVPNTRDGAVFRDEYVLYQPGQVALRESLVKPRGQSSWFLEADFSENDNSSNDANGDDSDDTLPQWFRQLNEYKDNIEEHEVTEVGANDEVAELAKSLNDEPMLNSVGTKQLDLDKTCQKKDTEGSSEDLSLQMDLEHFNEPSPQSETKKPRLPLITGAPPPPLEQYVYNEGRTQTPLRPGGNKKPSERLGGNKTASDVYTSPSGVPADEILNGAMLAKKIGVDRPLSPEPKLLREDNGERIAMDRLKMACQYHLAKLSEQLCRDAALSLEWKDTFLPLILRISDKVAPNMRKDAMDIRQYVKFKKITGGRKSDCQFFSGVVFSKNISNKKMASTLINPKILVLKCAIDYQRNENRLASLDPLILQEHNFLKNLVSRVVALKPTVLLVEKTVSRVAQDMLLEQGITLALNVKPEVIERVARCTKADILYSMEALTRPQLGTCQQFTVQKFRLKNGNTKTLMFFDGCPPELGCTVTLRGGNSFVLARVKKIMKHLVYVAYNLKLELQFLMDEFALPPSSRALVTTKGDYSEKLDKTERSLEEDGKEGETSVSDKKNGKYSGGNSSIQISSDAEEDAEAKKFQTALDETILSSSPNVVYPLPYLLTPEGQSCGVRNVLPKGVYWSVRLLPGYNKQAVVREDEYEEVDEMASPGKRKRSKSVVVLSPHPLMSAILTRSASNKEVQALLADFRARGGTIELQNRVGSKERVSCPWYSFKSNLLEKDEENNKRVEQVVLPLSQVEDFQGKILDEQAHECQVAPYSNKDFSEFNEKRELSQKDSLTYKQREGTNELNGRKPMIKLIEIPKGFKKDSEQNQEGRQFLHKSPVHFGRRVDALNPYNHQRIAVLFSSYSSESNNSPRLCISPWAVFMEFYGRNDITLGGFLERYCFRPSYICPNPNCDVAMVNHVRYFAHGTGSVFINMRNLESPIPGFQHKILTWSWCKECKQVTPIVPLSEQAWAISFAKYLELRFYAHSYTRRASIEDCGHSLHRDHFQYFAYANMVASFKYRAIKLFEAFIPPPWISVKESKREASYWINDVQALATRGDTVFASILDRIESLKTVDQQISEREAKFKKFEAHLQDDQSRFHDHVKVVESKATSLKETLNPQAVENCEMQPEELDAREREAMEYVIADSLNGLKRILCEIVDSWNKRFQELIQAEKRKIGKTSPNLVLEGKLSTSENREDSISLSEEATQGYSFESLSNSPSSSYTIAMCPEPVARTDESRNPEIEMSSSRNEGYECIPSFDLTCSSIEGISGWFTVNGFISSSPGEAKDMQGVPVETACNVVSDHGSGLISSSPGAAKDMQGVPVETACNVVSEQVSALTSTSPGAAKDMQGVPVKTACNVVSEQGYPCNSKSITPDGLLLQMPVTMKVNSLDVKRRSQSKKGHRRVASMPPRVTITSTEGVTRDLGTAHIHHAESGSGGKTFQRRRSEPELSSTVNLHSRDCVNQTKIERDGTCITPCLISPEDHRESSKDDCELRAGDLHKNKMGDKSPLLRKKDAMLKRTKLGKALSVPMLDGCDQTQEGLLMTDGGTSVMPKKRDKMKHIISSLLAGPAFQPVSTTFPSHEHHLLPPGEKVLVVVSEKEPSSIIAYALSTKEYNVRLCSIKQHLSRLLASRNGREEQNHLTSKSGIKLLEQEKKPSEVVLKVGSDSDEDYISVDLDNENSQKSVNEDPGSDNQEFWHSSMEATVEVSANDFVNVKFEKKSNVHGVVSGSETDKEKDFKKKEVLKDNNESQINECKDDKTLVEFGFQSKDDKNPVDFHIKLPFADSSCKFYCSIYYAVQFCNLRKRIFRNGEDRYIRSLVHCVQWRARGGKSGSSFSKSLDDRFVMKQMSRPELQCFLEFAPHYFQYINKALDEKRPTLLAKILGVYRIGFRNSHTNANMRQDVLVMENLFYDRKIDKIFDLKGSMRSRYVQSSGTDDVLMDENLLELIREEPIFIRPHSKAVISRAIHNDTEFLSQHMVMDYSLLVGLDETSLELVIGVIDFIRTFTWDKKLEMYVKSSGILGGQGKMPTVVSPEVYRTRFNEAMHRYFLMVPDKWTGLGNELVYR